MPPDRRTVLKSAALAGGAVWSHAAAAREPAPRDADAPGSPGSPPWRITDSNVSLFHWPFRRLPHDEPAALADKLLSLGVAEAWAGSYEGLLHRDLGEVNRRLAAACREHGEGFFVPFGSINPSLPGWEEDLRACREEHGMPGVRLHPGYHGYDLSDPCLPPFLEAAAGGGLLVQVAVSLEDERTQHPLVRVADTDPAPLAGLLASAPGARVQVLNWKPRREAPPELAAAPGLFFDMARVDATDGVARLLRSAGRERVLFGSHAPFFIPESALIKVHESDLAPEELAALLEGNARAARAAAA